MGISHMKNEITPQMLIGRLHEFNWLTRKLDEKDQRNFNKLHFYGAIKKH